MDDKSGYGEGVLYARLIVESSAAYEFYGFSAIQVLERILVQLPPKDRRSATPMEKGDE